MKIQYKQGWFAVRPSGLKLEVTYSDGRQTYCEDLRTRSWSDASEYCRTRIEGAA